MCKFKCMCHALSPTYCANCRGNECYKEETITVKKSIFDGILKYKDKIESMLNEVLNEIQYQEPGVVLGNDIKEWHLKYKKN